MFLLEKLIITGINKFNIRNNLKMKLNLLPLNRDIKIENNNAVRLELCNFVRNVWVNNSPIFTAIQVVFNKISLVKVIEI